MKGTGSHDPVARTETEAENLSAGNYRHPKSSPKTTFDRIAVQITGVDWSIIATVEAPYMERAKYQTVKTNKYTIIQIIMKSNSKIHMYYTEGSQRARDYVGFNKQARGSSRM